MNTINPYALMPGSRVASDVVGTATPSAVLRDEDQADSSTFTRRFASTSTVSALARQLSEAATRTDQKSTDFLDLITGESYYASKTVHDAEVPSTNEPELLARARQATGFVNGADNNPFKGLARDQLELIVRDEGGSFTINERRAAWEEVQSNLSASASSPKSTSFNGRDFMIDRLFHGSEPPVAKPPATRDNSYMNPAEFLNLDDRSLIADMYAYAHAEGADLTYVTYLASILSTYRYYSDGSQLRGGNNGYDADGYRVTFDFKKEEAQIASRILNGSAINSTRIDQGFLRYILHPDHGAFTNIGGIPFLERMVNKFSDEGDDQPPLGSEFAAFKKINFEDYAVRTTNKAIRLPPDKSVATVTNGVWSLTEYGKASGYVIDSATGKLSRPSDSPGEKTPQHPPLGAPATDAAHRTILDALADTRDQPAQRWIWPGHLFKMLRAFKP
ncbi:hypothetical protein EXW72_01050 [Pseudomonas sp. BCA14]|uniref:hypothetical protein n=1 Tax=unclassified Pseudomonas TaxID=196821 RepID=UPI00106E935D|nr:MULTISPECIES: hypothetical protein [unclassified Pseudomonas]TFF13449.1 hypothetical protein EXW70_02640 [Pseudomonas sp. JMN1]TFF15867.1 hypothetical protein EXW71_06400 [Pseudomonas sp. BCA17]TFF29803.1 hypothetical protein EXW73_05635 [Pseudomonas sp. BCA13]TFF30645.1 hypothetical protein EXW72_01050 [Pseudomonas sp. BCA14]